MAAAGWPQSRRKVRRDRDEYDLPLARGLNPHAVEGVPRVGARAPRPGWRRLLQPDGLSEVVRTGLSIFPYALSVSGMLAVSNSPLSFDRARWRKGLGSYHIDGHPCARSLGSGAPAPIGRDPFDSANRHTGDARGTNPWTALDHRREYGCRVQIKNGFGRPRRDLATRCCPMDEPISKATLLRQVDDLRGRARRAWFRAAPRRNAQAGWAAACFRSVPERCSVQRRHGTHHAPSSSMSDSSALSSFAGSVLPARASLHPLWESFCAAKAISTCFASHGD